jgi:type I restriction enzyme, S subunit
MRIQWRQLKELCSSDIERINPALTPNDEFWYVDISSIDRVNKTISKPILTKGESASVRARQIIRENDVLVSTTRPNLNAVALVPEKYNEQICSTGFCVLRCGEELDSEYLFYFSRCNTFINSLSNLVQGALYPAVTNKQVLSQLIPWVPFERQRKIATRLKSQLIEVEKAHQAVKAQLQDLQILKSAILKETFTKEP